MIFALEEDESPVVAVIETEDAREPSQARVATQKAGQPDARR